MVEIVVLDEVIAWYQALDQKDTDAVYRAISQLESSGTTLPFPLSSKINGSKIAMRELRIQSGGDPIRVLYVFDPKRQAVLLLGGDKGGDGNWYVRNIPIAEKRYEKYLSGGY